MLCPALPSLSISLKIDASYCSVYTLHFPLEIVLSHILTNQYRKFRHTNNSYLNKWSVYNRHNRHYVAVW